MESSHAPQEVDVRFDDPNMVSVGGLVPLDALAAQVGTAELTRAGAAGATVESLLPPGFSEAGSGLSDGDTHVAVGLFRGTVSVSASRVGQPVMADLRLVQ